MKKLFMTKGLPASGKSTWAKEQVTLSNGRTKRVNKDDLRAMIDPKFSPDKEKATVAARNALVSGFLQGGFNVIVDDTNFAPVHEQTLRAFATKFGAEFKLVDFTDVPVETCLKRDLGRPGSVGHNVIMDMYYRYLCAPSVKWDSSLPDCVISDIDGTLAKAVGRGPFQEDKVGSDVLRPAVYHTVTALVREQQADLIVFSGRQDSCREDTSNWLMKHNLFFRALHMRAHGDKRPDFVVKEELYRAHIEGKYNVVAIFDDRPQVLRMWERIGLGDRLFRCGDSMREF